MVSSRKLQYADRVALQQADQAIRKDVLRALVEIITNCNDSYSRLEHNGLTVSGEIMIEITRKHKNSLIRVRDLLLKPDGPRQQLSGTVKLVASFQKNPPKKAAPGAKPSTANAKMVTSTAKSP